MLTRLIAILMLSPLAWGQALEQGKRAFDAGNYAEAARLFEKAHQETRRCDILFFLGLARYRMAQIDPALIAFQAAAKCDPKLVPAHLALAEAYLERRNEGGAIEALLQVLSVEPGNKDALRGTASIYLRNQLNEKALPLLEKLITVESKDLQARVDLGAAYAATGDRDKAEEQFQESLRLKPDHPSALMGLGNLYLKKGEEERAIALLQKTIAIVPGAFEPRFLLGSAYNRLGRYEEAISELQRALRLGGEDSAEIYYHLARAYGGAGRQEDRRQALSRFAELTQKSKQSTEDHRRALRLVEQAKKLVDSGDLLAAAGKMEEARELRPSDGSILFRLGSLYYDLGRYDRARNYVQEALSLAPSEWLTHHLLGLVELRSGQWKQARESLEIAVKLNPSASESYNALGEVALRQRNPTLAIESFKRATELDPQQQTYRLNLAAAQRAAGRAR
ncbi:MAG: tetratricopeptide repeat protein [Bryobacteraceae bacterium]